VILINIKKYLNPKNYAYKINNFWKKLNLLINFINNNCAVIGKYFSSTVIHVNSSETQQNWMFLNRGYENEQLLKDLIQKIRHHTMVTYDRLLTTYNISQYILQNRIKGAFVETGTWWVDQQP